MYSLCKEMLDGFGLEELAKCAGLSPTMAENILKHSHARNNLAVLFNLACAVIIHLIDITLQEDSSLSSEVARLHKRRSEKKVSADSGASTSDEQKAHHGLLYSATSNVVTSDIIRIGEALRAKIQSRFTTGPNGKHFVGTLLFSCLLPTIGFHVLSRTGHTDFNSVLIPESMHQVGACLLV